MKKPVVSIQKCQTYNTDEIQKRLLELLKPLGGMGAFINKGETALIKPNLLKASHPDEAVTTHPALVEAVVKEVQALGAVALIGDSPGFGKLTKIYDATQMSEVARKTGATLTPFTESLEIEPRRGAIFKKIEIAKEVVNADKIINLPKVKTHAQMRLTLGVKNCFGAVVGPRKAQWHVKAGVSRDDFADLILDIHNSVNPVLSIADAVVSMEGNGPGGGDPRKTGLIFASSSAPAMDSVITEILGFFQEEIALNMACKRRALTPEALEDIVIKGAQIDAVKIDGFKAPKMISMEFGPPFIQRFMKNAVTAKPDIRHDECVLCLDCVNACPAEVMEALNKKIHIDYENCIRCYCCQEICPEGVIAPKQGWLLRLFEINPFTAKKNA